MERTHHDGGIAAGERDWSMIDAASIRPGTVHVLIGPNGSRKSRLLRKLPKRETLKGDHL